MKNYRLAWRNIWRNKRRTLITVASVFFATFFALLMRSLQLGSYGHMFQNAIESYSGYIQVQQENFWDDQIVDNTFEATPELEEQLLAQSNVADIIPRFESFALASSGPRTKGVLVMGIDPGKEQNMNGFEDRIVKYRLTPEALETLKADERIPDKVKKVLDLFSGNVYSNDARLQLDLGISDREASDILPLIKEAAASKNGTLHRGEPGALIGDKLSRYLGLGIGDTIVLISQGYHGTTAAGKYEIKGVVKQPVPDIDSRVVYLPVDICQSLYNAEGLLTSMVLQVRDHSDKAIAATVCELRSEISSPYRILDWKKMNELIIQQMDADNKSGMIMIGILYLVIAFGVFGTVLMMTAERRREFGVLVAIGMQKRKLSRVLSLEMLYIGFLGILSGITLALPVIIYGYFNPIRFSGNMAKMFEDYGFDPVMAFSWIDTYFVWQAVVVAIMVFIAMLYPVSKIRRLQVINALRA